MNLVDEDNTFDEEPAIPAANAEESLYAILNVDDEATAQDITVAYKRLSRIYQ